MTQKRIMIVFKNTQCKVDFSTFDVASSSELPNSVSFWSSHDEESGKVDRLGLLTLKIA